MKELVLTIFGTHYTFSIYETHCIKFPIYQTHYLTFSIYEIQKWLFRNQEMTVYNDKFISKRFLLVETLEF